MAKSNPSERMGSIITFRVPDGLFKKLSDEAEKSNESMSDLIRRALREMFQFPIGYKCEHFMVVTLEETSIPPSMECGCIMKAVFEMSEITTGKLKIS